MAKVGARAPWEWWRIKGALEERGLTLVAVAATAGIARGTAHTVKTKRTPCMQAAIAKAIGVPPDFIWPDRYDAGGKPIPDPMNAVRWAEKKQARERRRGSGLPQNDVAA